MKWGQYKAREISYRKKLAAIRDSGSADGTSDAKRFAYRNQSAAARIGKTAVTVVRNTVIKDILTGKIANYPNITDKEIKKRITDIAIKTATNVALNDALAKSASKRYTDSGNKAEGVKTRSITKEDAISTGVKTAMRVAPIAKWMLLTKAKSVRANREKNEAAFKKWGANILSEKVTNYVSPISVTVI